MKCLRDEKDMSSSAESAEPIEWKKIHVNRPMKSQDIKNKEDKSF